ncbi:hypothetical protein DFH09DRAFT_1431678 [Mycena vulgaris]|nr:hypothetical protein DFH09DRAFT_1431678 [Mycena vulgaris]
MHLIPSSLGGVAGFLTLRICRQRVRRQSRKAQNRSNNSFHAQPLAAHLARSHARTQGFSNPGTRFETHGSHSARSHSHSYPSHSHPFALPLAFPRREWHALAASCFLPSAPTLALALSASPQPASGARTPALLSPLPSSVLRPPSFLAAALPPFPARSLASALVFLASHSVSLPGILCAALAVNSHASSARFPPFPRSPSIFPAPPYSHSPFVFRFALLRPHLHPSSVFHLQPPSSIPFPPSLRTHSYPLPPPHLGTARITCDYIIIFPELMAAHLSPKYFCSGSPKTVLSISLRALRPRCSALNLNSVPWNTTVADRFKSGHGSYGRRC